MFLVTPAPNSAVGFWTAALAVHMEWCHSFPFRCFPGLQMVASTCCAEMHHAQVGGVEPSQATQGGWLSSSLLSSYGLLPRLCNDIRTWQLQGLESGPLGPNGTVVNLPGQ